MGDVLYFTVVSDFEFDVLAVENERRHTVHGVSSRNRRFLHRRRDKCFGKYHKAEDAQSIAAHAQAIVDEYRAKYDAKYEELDALRSQEKTALSQVLGPPLTDEAVYAGV